MADQAIQGRVSPLLQRAQPWAARPHLRGEVVHIGYGNGGLAALVRPVTLR
jgi:hypothetical protein